MKNSNQAMTCWNWIFNWHLSQLAPFLHLALVVNILYIPTEEESQLDGWAPAHSVNWLILGADIFGEIIFMITRMLAEDETKT